MAGWTLGSSEVANERAERYQGKVIGFVIVTCFVAAIGGCIFGYDIGVSGGVTSMDEFFKEFFHDVYEKKRHAHENNYCKFDNIGRFQLVTTIHGWFNLVATLMASPITRNYGRRASIICAGIFFLIGAAVNVGSVNLPMLRMDHDRFWYWI